MGDRRKGIEYVEVPAILDLVPDSASRFASSRGLGPRPNLERNSR